MSRPRTPGERRRPRRVRCPACEQLRYGPLIRGVCADCYERQQRAEAEFDRLIGPPTEAELNREVPTNNYGLYIGAPTPDVPEPLQSQVRAWWEEDTPALEEVEEPVIEGEDSVHPDWPYGRSPLQDLLDEAGVVRERLCRRGHQMEQGEIRCYVCHPLEEDERRERIEGGPEVMFIDARPEAEPHIPPAMRDEEPEPEPSAAVRGEPEHDLDLASCLEYNPQDGFGFEDITRVLAYLPGAWDGEAFHWLLELWDGTYVYLTGSCDYTGWDCQSHAQSWGGTSPYAAITEHTVTEADEDIARRLMSQVLGGFIAGVRERIGKSLEIEAAKRHKVFQARINGTWVCENCDFMSGNATDARKHSEQRKIIQPPPGWVRRKRRDL